MTVAFSSLRTWLATALSNGAVMPGLDDASARELISVAEKEGVLPLLERLLRSNSCWQEFPDDVRMSLAAGARTAAMQALVHGRELQRIAALFSGSGARALLLKGNALGLWLYPQPYMRVTSDIDLLFPSRTDADDVARALATLGYVLEFSPGSMNYEMKCKLIVDGQSRCELDLHSRLLNAPAYAGIFSFDELWSRSIVLPGMGESLRGLSMDHAFAHACLNRALDMQSGVPDQLKLLYDMHLIMGRMGEGDWQEFVQLLASKHISGIGMRSIDDAVQAFGSKVSIDALNELRGNAESESVKHYRLDDWRYLQWENLKAIPGPVAKMHWLWQRAFPTYNHLRELHGDGNWFQLMARRARRGLSRLRNKG